MNLGLLIFIIYLIIRGYFTHSALFAIKSLSIWFFGVLLYFSICSAFQNEVHIKFAVYSIVTGCFLSAFYGITQYLGWDQYILPLRWAGRTLSGKNIVISTFGNSNYLAEYLVPASVLVLTFFILGVKSSFKNFLGIVTLTLLLSCLIVTGVRAAYLQMPIAISLLFLCLKAPNTQHFIFKKAKLQNSNQSCFASKNRCFTILIFVLTFLILGFVMFRWQIVHPDWLAKQILSLRDVHVLHSRFLIWQVAFEMIKQYPIFGIGPGNFKVYYFDYLYRFLTRPENYFYLSTTNLHKGENANQTHNDYLQLWAETGTIGLSIFLWIVLFFLMKIFRIRKKIVAENMTRQKMSLAGLAVAVIIILIDAIINFPLQLPANGILFWAILGLFTASMVKGSDITSKVQDSKFSRKIFFQRLMFYILVLIFLVAVICWTLKTALADIYLKKGLKFLRSGNLKEAKSLFIKAGKLDSVNGETYLALGVVELALGSPEASIKNFKLANLYGTNDYTRIVGLGEAYLRAGEFSKAYEEFKKALVIYPESEEVKKLLAFSHPFRKL